MTWTGHTQEGCATCGATEGSSVYFDTLPLALGGYRDGVNLGFIILTVIYITLTYIFRR